MMDKKKQYVIKVYMPNGERQFALFEGDRPNGMTDDATLATRFDDEDEANYRAIDFVLMSGMDIHTQVASLNAVLAKDSSASVDNDTHSGRASEKQNLTELVFIVDKSGSMGGLVDDTIGGFNTMLAEQQAEVGDAVVTTVLFDRGYELLHDRINIKAVCPLTRKDYKIGGGTALLDAIGKTIHKIRAAQKNTKEEYRPNKTMFVIITDGQENSSRKYTAQDIREKIEHQKTKYGWEFVFFGANMDAISEAANIGIDAAHAQNYNADAVGTGMAWRAMSLASSEIRRR